MPMRLDDGWNQIQFNLADFTRRAYGTNYVETLRVQIHANCRIRRVYFSDRLYSEDELPAEFKLYLPVIIRFLTNISKSVEIHVCQDRIIYATLNYRFNKNNSNNYNNSKIRNSKFLNKLLVHSSKKKII